MLLTIPQPSSAQSKPSASDAAAESAVAPSNKVEMADAMRQDGKIYVVVAVILLIFSGLVIYTIRIDQKVSKLEKELR